jgi:hypothetical protein
VQKTESNPNPTDLGRRAEVRAGVTVCNALSAVVRPDAATLDLSPVMWQGSWQGRNSCRDPISMTCSAGSIDYF